MSIKSALAVGIGATTIASVGAVYAVNYLTTSSIEQEILNSKRTILRPNSNTWGIKLNTYTNELKSAVTLESEDEAGLKKWYKATLKSNFKDSKDDNYLNARKLCTTPTNKEKLLHAKKELSDDNDWNTKLASYNNKGTNKNSIVGINVGSANKKQIKDWCEKIWEEEILEVETIYILAEKWCTK